MTLQEFTDLFLRSQEGRFTIIIAIALFIFLAERVPQYVINHLKWRKINKSVRKANRKRKNTRVHFVQQQGKRKHY